MSLGTTLPNNEEIRHRRHTKLVGEDKMVESIGITPQIAAAYFALLLSCAVVHEYGVVLCQFQGKGGSPFSEEGNVVLIDPGMGGLERNPFKSHLLHEFGSCAPTDNITFGPLAHHRHEHQKQTRRHKDKGKLDLLVGRRGPHRYLETSEIRHISRVPTFEQPDHLPRIKSMATPYNPTPGLSAHIHTNDTHLLEVLKRLDLDKVLLRKPRQAIDRSLSQHIETAQEMTTKKDMDTVRDQHILQSSSVGQYTFSTIMTSSYDSTLNQTTVTRHVTSSSPGDNPQGPEAAAANLPTHRTSLTQSTKSCAEKCYRYLGINLPCSCDILCFVYQRCCDDIDEVCPNMRQSANEKLGVSLMKATRTCNVESNTFYIKSCPNDEEVTAADELFNGVDILVSDESTGVVYQNMQIFRCHTQGFPQAKAVFWKVVIGLISEWNGVDSFTDVPTLIRSSKFHFIPASDDPRHKGYKCVGDGLRAPSYRFSVVLDISSAEELQLIPTTFDVIWQPLTCDLTGASASCLQHECADGGTTQTAPNSNCRFKVFINNVVSQPEIPLPLSLIESIAEDFVCAFRSLPTTINASVIDIRDNVLSYHEIDIPSDVNLSVPDVSKIKYFRVLIEAEVIAYNATDINNFFKELVAYRLQEREIVFADKYYRYGVPLVGKGTGDNNEPDEIDNGISLKRLKLPNAYEPRSTETVITESTTSKSESLQGRKQTSLKDGTGGDETELDITSGDNPDNGLERMSHDQSDSNGLANADEDNGQTNENTNDTGNQSGRASLIRPFLRLNHSTTKTKIQSGKGHAAEDEDARNNRVRCRPERYLMICVGIYIEVKPSELAACRYNQKSIVEVVRTDSRLSLRENVLSRVEYDKCGPRSKLKEGLCEQSHPSLCCSGVETDANEPGPNNMRRMNRGLNIKAFGAIENTDKNTSTEMPGRAGRPKHYETTIMFTALFVSLHLFGGVFNII